MKIKALLTPIVSAVIGGIFVLYFIAPSKEPTPSSTAAEPVYQKVMASGTIRCGYFTWPPYVMKDPNTGKLSGLNYDFMEEVGRLLDLKIEWTVETSAGSVVTDLQNGKYDVSCVSVWPDAARMKVTLMTNPQAYSSVLAWARADDTRFDGSLQKINDPSITIAGIDGDFSGDIIKQDYAKAKRYALPQNAEGVFTLTAVVDKKADVVFADEGIVKDFLKARPGTLRQIAGVKPVRIYGEHLLVPSGEYHLKSMIDNAFITMTNNGTAAAILKKYEGGFYPPKTTYDLDYNKP